MGLTKEAVDRIVYAVEHWADDIDDPVVLAMNIEMEAMVNAVLKAYAEQKGMKYPGGIPRGRAKFWIKFDNGDKYDITSNW
jgi:hypothetical protein